jgi:hypothetical protein
VSQPLTGLPEDPPGTVMVGELTSLSRPDHSRDVTMYVPSSDVAKLCWSEGISSTNSNPDPVSR